ncbi:Wadjet anti-phage system protein JetD domain-containing protein [Paenibacillus sp. y28]|uniref:Wadjet anti-phage system protein JetD domain-containing protein n=1 Tax=Paenibacillus sp. y28 TaxID=3129110 RepID=UPI003016090E
MTDVQYKLLAFIRSLQRASVWTEELEKCVEGEPITYEQFAGAVLALEEGGLLREMKSAGRRAKPPKLAERYRIHKAALRSELHQRLHRYRLELHPLISLDRYFSEEEDLFAGDLPYLQSIDRYLHDQGLPDDAASAEERSFALVGDEKWVTEKKGRAILERIGLWDKLLIAFASDPLMMAVHPGQLAGSSDTAACLHLIVENKATFQALLPALPETRFHTLIYGCGNKIVGNLEMFPQQYPIQGREHRFYYFGDLDYTGIQIWHHLSMKQPVIPAMPFYTACLDRAPAKGKTNQRRDDQALRDFMRCLSSRDGKRLEESLSNGCYYPQEALPAQELRDIWRNAVWS